MGLLSLQFCKYFYLAKEMHKNQTIKLRISPGGSGTLIPVPGRQRQVDVCELESSLVYTARSLSLKKQKENQSQLG